jgi:hypothetical protein
MRSSVRIREVPPGGTGEYAGETGPSKPVRFWAIVGVLIAVTFALSAWAAHKGWVFSGNRYSEGAYEQMRTARFEQGYDTGYAEGFGEGRQQGAQLGLREGRDSGYQAAFRKGRTKSHRLGYEEGFAAGYASVPVGFVGSPEETANYFLEAWRRASPSDASIVAAAEVVDVVFSYPSGAAAIRGCLQEPDATYLCSMDYGLVWFDLKLRANSSGGYDIFSVQVFGDYDI